MLAVGYASRRVRPVSSAELRPAGSQKVSLTCSKRKSVTLPAPSRTAEAMMTDSSTPLSRAATAGLEYAGVVSPGPSRVPTTWAQACARAATC